VENVGAGELVRSSGTLDVVEAEDGGISKRCWNRSDLSSDFFPIQEQLDPPDGPVRLYIQCPTTPPPFPSSIPHHDPYMRIQSQIPRIFSKQRRSRLVSKSSISSPYTSSISRWYFERHVAVKRHVFWVSGGWYRCQGIGRESTNIDIGSGREFSRGRDGLIGNVEREQGLRRWFWVGVHSHH
jgi:hypothetical protein